MTCEDCNCFRAGDDVRIITSGLVGRINSSDETGTYHEIWLYGFILTSGEPKKLERVPSWQLEHAADDTEPGAREDLPGDNVIPVDFTRRQKLTAKTKTKGSA